MKRQVVWLLRMYQKFLSLDTGLIRLFLPMRGKVCRHFPSCSEYTIEAVEKYGTLKGLMLGCIRIMKCNPLGTSGEDLLK